MEQISKYFLKSLWYGFLLFFTYLMILITIQYIPINLEVAFLKIKVEAISHLHYQIAFFSHIYTSILVLIAGLSQFSQTIRTRIPIVHRNLGKLYVLLVLAISSPSGLVMAFYANGGIISKISFVIQAILWFIFTLKALLFIRKKDWINHRYLMIRSYALTLSAISLRIFKWMIANTLELPPMDTYRIVAWMGWLFNLAIAELYIQSLKSRKAKIIGKV